MFLVHGLSPPFVLFSALAFRRLRHVPLKLEWAPKQIFSDEFVSAAAATDETRKLSKKSKKEDLRATDDGSSAQRGANRAGASAQLSTDGAKDDVAQSSEERTQAGDDGAPVTIYVKNLNFSTGEESLRAVFESVVSVRAIAIPKKPDPKNTGKKLSMGFGFVEVSGKGNADRAMAALEGVKV